MKFQCSAVFWMLVNASSSSSFATSRSNVHTGGSLQSGTKEFTPRTSSSIRVPFGVLTRGGSSSSAAAAVGGRTQLSASSSVEIPTAVTSENLALLSERGRQALTRFIEKDVEGYQAHVYSHWPEAGSQDDDKRRLAEQVRVTLGCSTMTTTTTTFSLSLSLSLTDYPLFCFLQLADLDSSYPGGLASYLSKARTLLKESADGLNPFEDYEAVVPEGESLSFDGEGTMSFSEAEQLGIQAMEGAVFVLVAGGLGERLGYSGIKLSLETNLCTNTSYLHMYIKYIKAMEFLARTKTGKDSIRIPLVIMTSGDTDPMTRKLLADNDNFGMDDDMISIVCQDKVAALKDGNAGLALEDDDRWTIQTKPHGHGDVHQLLHREGLVDQWEKEGRTHVVFLQDTNALVVNSIVPTLGVSVSKGFHMNSICVPRLAGEAAGAIARLE